MKKRDVSRREPGVTGEDIRNWERLPKARRKLRIYADTSVPMPSVEVLRSVELDVHCSLEDISAAAQEDEFHFAAARQMNRLLLTTDNDFWDDRRFPLHRSGGVVVVLPGQDRDPLASAMLFYWGVAALLKEGVSGLPNIWRGSKIRVTRDQVVERRRTYDSRVEETVLWRKPSVNLRS